VSDFVFSRFARKRADADVNKEREREKERERTDCLPTPILGGRFIIERNARDITILRKFFPGHLN